MNIIFVFAFILLLIVIIILIKPKSEDLAKYYDSTAKTVQYGDSIELTMNVEIKMEAFMDLKASIPVTIKKTSQSQQYWK